MLHRLISADPGSHQSTAVKRAVLCHNFAEYCKSYSNRSIIIQYKQYRFIVTVLRMARAELLRFMKLKEEMT